MLESIANFISAHYNLVFYGFMQYTFTILVLKFISKAAIFSLDGPIDRIVCSTFSFLALFFIFNWLSQYQLFNQEAIAFHKRSMNQFWVFPVFYPIFILLSSQILWFSSVRKNKLLRIILALIIILIPVIETYIIFVTSLQTQMMPSKWAPEMTFISVTDSLVYLFGFFCFAAIAVGIRFYLDRKKKENVLEKNSIH